MQYRLQLFAFRVIGEYAQAQFPPVYGLVVSQDARSEAVDDGLVCGLTRRRQTSRDVVGVDDGHSVSRKQFGYGGFSAAYAAGQAYA
jgi:hypothetical protein